MKTLFLSLACAALAATASAFPATYRVSGTVGHAPRTGYVVPACAPRVAVVASVPVCYAAPVYNALPVFYAPRPVVFGRPAVVCERVSYGHSFRPSYPRIEARVVVRR